MAKLRFEAELEYDADVMYADDEDGKDWFINEILRAPPGPMGLLLHSNEMGDTIGEVTVLRIIE